MKTQYDQKSNQAGFQEGLIVWFQNPMCQKGKFRNLWPNWEGLYKVITRINQDNDTTHQI